MTETHYSPELTAKLANIYRFTACIVTADEYFIYVKDDLLSLAWSEIETELAIAEQSGRYSKSKLHQMRNKALQQQKDRKQGFAEFEAMLKRFSKKLYTPDGSDQIVERMIDGLHGILKEITLEITK